MNRYTKEQIREAVNLVIGDDGKRADEVLDLLETDVEANTINYNAINKEEPND
tara:strand:+ start:763 stop:921 length:159 start_codon:yes stop_codon:yes gene_type:complete